MQDEELCDGCMQTVGMCLCSDYQKSVKVWYWYQSRLAAFEIVIEKALENGYTASDPFMVSLLQLRAQAIDDMTDSYKEMVMKRAEEVVHGVRGHKGT